MSDKVYLQVDRFLRPEEFEYLEKQFKKKDENIVLLPYGVKVVKPEVIYCKECKWWPGHGMYADTYLWRYPWCGSFKGNEFCSKGERKK